MIKDNIKNISAFAPASSSNFSVGYDVLGFPFSALGDEITLTFNDSKRITIDKIEGGAELPLDPNKNTATYALSKMCDFLKISPGLSVTLKKGIPLCSGLGGSAASSVAAVYALNQALITPLSKKRVASFAIEAEGLASGESHADNVVPSLWGELTLVRQLMPLDVIVLPMPGLYCTLIHPEMKISTQSAREALDNSLLLKTHVAQSANLASLISSFYTRDWSLLKRSCQDIIVEPQRSHLLPGFYEVKESALALGALTCTFSGAGPTLVALSETADKAESIGQAMRVAFEKNGLKSQTWSRKMTQDGPKIVRINDEIS